MSGTRSSSAVRIQRHRHPSGGYNCAVDLHTLRKTITDNADADYWNKLTGWGWGSGPMYHFSLSSESTDNGIQTEAKSHANTAVLISDVDISIAWGWDPDESLWQTGGGREFDFSDFLPTFPDDTVSRMYVDVFYRGNLVDRSLFVVADGGRYYLPIPRTEYPNKTGHGPGEYGEPEHHYTSWDLGLAWLVNSFEHAEPIKSVLDRMTYVVDD